MHTSVFEFGYWLQTVLDDYIIHLNEGGEPVKLNSRSGNWDSQDKVRASSLAACPKFHAAERLGLVKKEFAPNMYYRFELAVRAAELYAESVSWGIEQEGYVFTEKRMIKAEQPVAGTMDILLKRGKFLIPIEIKYTSADKYDGYSDYQVWQLIAYMELVGANFAYLVTLYDWQSKMGTHKVWTVGKTEHGWAVFDTEEGRLTGQNDTFTRDEYQRMIEAHQSSYRLAKEKGLDAIPVPFETPVGEFRCGNTKLPEYYQGKYTNPYTKETFKEGDLKPKTGIFTPTCPLFSSCWACSGEQKIGQRDTMYVIQSDVQHHEGIDGTQ